MILADGNLLIAKSWDAHSENARAEKFFADNPKVLTCPITELNLVRVLMQRGLSGAEADKVLQNFISRHRSRLIPCDISATEIKGQCDGHRETTDVYLAALAKKHRLKIATLDSAFAEKFPDRVELV